MDQRCDAEGGVRRLFVDGVEMGGGLGGGRERGEEESVYSGISKANKKVCGGTRDIKRALVNSLSLMERGCGIHLITFPAGFPVGHRWGGSR